MKILGRDPELDAVHELVQRGAAVVDVEGHAIGAITHGTCSASELLARTVIATPPPTDRL